MLLLSQAIRRMGRPAARMPGFAASRMGGLLRSARVADFSPEQVEFLTYGRGVDTTRMRAVLGFQPRYDTPGAFADFARSARPGLVDPARVAAAERRLKGLLIREEQHG
jgi:UDP-glucose 4-epimerase